MKPSKGEREGEEHTNARTFRRDPGAPFDDLRVENYVKARAKGGSVLAASTAAGVQKGTGIRWEKEPEVKARIGELRIGAEDFIGVSLAYVFTGLKKNAEQARDNGAFKASNEALFLIYKLMKEDKSSAAQMAAALPPAEAHGAALNRRLRESFSSPVIDVAPEPDEEPVEAQNGDA